MISAGATASPRITKPDNGPAGGVAQTLPVADFDLGVPSPLSAPDVAEAAAVALDATLLALDEQDNVVRALPVQFSSRVSAGTTATLFGADRSGAIRVVATVTMAPPHLKLNLRYVPGGAVLPRQLLASFRFLRALRLPNRLALDVGERRMAEFAQLPAEAQLAREQVEFLRSLAFVQALTRTEFPVPSQMDDEDLQTVQDAKSLLRGDTLSSRWTEATLALSTIDDVFLGAVEGSGPFRVEIVAPIAIQIAERSVPLGDARYVFRAAILDNHDELVALAGHGDVSDAEARLRPHPDDDTYEVALVAPPEIGLDLHDVRPPVVVSDAQLAEARLTPLTRDAFRSAAS